MTDIVERLRACLRFDEPKWSNCESEIELAAREAADKLASLRALSLAMAEDEGLWFQAQTAPEAYLQQQLRRLMREIEE